jgi:hypothetical protein
MKATGKILVSAGLILATLGMLSSCQKEMSDSGAGYASVLDVSDNGTSTVISQNMQSAFVETPDLSEAELAILLKMKEEEKLARDIYTALYQKWGSTIFSQIQAAEENHMNAIIGLLEYYGSADTQVGEAGTFVNNEIQALYNELLAKGYESLSEAYITGALIEEMDIKDLNDAMAATANANIIMVFENLERGSRNHLRAFFSQLTNLGIVYTPVYITQSEYDQIVTSAMEKGNQYRMNGKGNGNHGFSGQGKRNGRN